ncbi:MAG: cytochrome c biogenesis protein CcsA [Reichenbachiella sp.]
MQSIFLKVLLSNRLTTVLLLLFAIAMGYGTFLENDFGTQAVKTMIYGAWWFELIMLLLTINFIGNIFKYNLIRKEKLPILTFHIAFIIILIGAFITRYVSFEGLMHIREGESISEIVSQDRYLQIKYKNDEGEKYYEEKLVLSYFSQPDIELTLGDGGNEFTVNAGAFVPQAEQKIIESENGGTVISIVTTNSTGRENLYLQSGGAVVANNMAITLDNPLEGAINLFDVEGELRIQSPIDLSYMIMATQSAGSLPADTVQDLRLRALYRGETVAFVVPEVFENSAVVYRQSDDSEKAKRLDDMLFLKLKGNNSSQELMLKAYDGNFSETQHLNLSGYHVDVTYGPKPIKIPFSIELRDFQLERYPGSVSPSSYASEVTVIDGDTSFPYRVYMNNVLDYKGYRFFQASYDNDELGTVLSVNQDRLGTIVTYIGYTLLSLGMMLTLFGKGSRFQYVNRRLSDLNAKKGAAILVLLMLVGQVQAQDAFDYKTVLRANQLSEEHAGKFGALMVQDLDGRIKPINTLSSEFLRKVHGKSSFEIEDDYVVEGDELFLMINLNPLVWQTVPIIKIDPKKGAEILNQLGLEAGSKNISFKDFIDEQGNYLLIDLVEEANKKKPSERNGLDDEIIKVDERFNVFFQGLTGYFLKIFPLEDDMANTWFNDKVQPGTFTGEDSVFVSNIMPMYFQSILDATKSGDWANADETLSYIRTYQNVKGIGVIPSTNIQNAEILYNKLKLFNHLFSFFWLSGLALLTVALFQIFYARSKGLNTGYWILFGLVLMGFLALTFNLILRWYAAQYPPWSNGYEMLILVSWALLLFGFIFFKKSNFVVPLAALFTGTLLFVGFLDWLNPEITSLVPVLKSYWLKIHVAIIVASYAPLGLCALLGILGLIFMIVDKGNNPILKNSIKELTYINEMSMSVGLFMLTIGTFLGGVWANESWGRYWGWDPKETWALISVIVYATILHLRLIPKLNDLFVFNVVSVWAFFSIIMTSFGVNYYLAGLHSYAKGDPVPVPQFIYWIVGFVLMISVLARVNYLKNKKLQGVS